MSISYAVFCLKKKNKVFRRIDSDRVGIEQFFYEAHELEIDLALEERTISVSDRHSLHNDLFFFFNDTATTEIYTLSLHDALPISRYGHASPQTRLSGCRAGAPAR